MLDFCKRIDLRTSNKRVIESLICAGAFDNLPGNRAQKFTELGRIIDIAVEYKKESSTGQISLFEIDAAHKKESDDLYAYQILADWDDKLN